MEVIDIDYFLHNGRKYTVEYYSDHSYSFFDYGTSAPIEKTEELEQALLEGL